MTAIDTHIAEINPYYFRRSVRTKKRINIFLPSINIEHVFGGISTAIKFFEKLADATGYDRRMILVDANPSAEAIASYGERYTLTAASEDSVATAQIVPYSERSPEGIAVSTQDYFIFTGWWTAHCAQEAYRVFERETGIVPNPFIYFIQDFEPGFYAWSTHYLLADATYRCPYRQIAIFNTSLLQEYFHKNGYTFYQEFVFEPVLNADLKDRLYQVKNSLHKKKQVLIYGRPGTERNAFKLIIAALKKWVWLQPDIEEWEIVSAGEQYEPVDLGNNQQVRSLGKLSLDGYADVLLESYAGISLMASPHPSYPPLEMAVFGVQVITNTFANKDLSSFNKNIVSLDNISPDHIAQRLEQICSGFRPVVEHQLSNQEYCENQDVFGFVKELCTVLENEQIYVGDGI